MDQIDVRILDREYRLAVKPEDKEQLLEAARSVDQKMRLIRDSGRLTGVDRIAVMVALQLANELIGLSRLQESPSIAAPASSAAVPAEATRRIRKMTADIDEAIKRQDSLF
jgi:cell division protein ZapA